MPPMSSLSVRKDGEGNPCGGIPAKAQAKESGAMNPGLVVWMYLNLKEAV